MVSIIIPVYNGSQYIGKCYDSIKSQSYKNLEIIFVNDGSTDNSDVILQDILVNDNRVIVISQKNQGVAIAREVGVKKALGDFIMFVDVDDTIAENSINSLVSSFSSEDIDIVIGGVDTITNNEIVKSYIPSPKLISNIEYLKSVLVFGRWELWGKMYRRKLFLENIDIPKGMKMGEDLVVLIQLAVFASRIKICSYLVYNYTENQNSVTHNRPDEYVNKGGSAITLVENILYNHNLGKVLQEEINALFLLSYCYSIFYSSRSRKDPYVRMIRKHFSIKSFLLINPIKSIIVLFSYYGGLPIQTLFRKIRKGISF